jgi:hypothetical protein
MHLNSKKDNSKRICLYFTSTCFREMFVTAHLQGNKGR